MPTEPLQFPTNVSEVIITFGTTKTRTLTHNFRTMLFYPLSHGNHWNGFSDKCHWNHKNIWHDRHSNPGPTAWEPCWTNSTAVIYLKKKSWQFWSEKKRPCWMKNISCILHIWRKITKQFKVERNSNSYKNVRYLQWVQCWNQGSKRFAEACQRLRVDILHFCPMQVDAAAQLWAYGQAWAYPEPRGLRNFFIKNATTFSSFCQLFLNFKFTFHIFCNTAPD